MKIRFDFVSNSSSTSFVIISRREISDLDYFLKMMGCLPDSPLLPFYRELHEAIMECRYPISDNPDKKTKEYYKLSAEVCKKIVKSLKSCEYVWVGDAGEARYDFVSFLKCDPFIVEEDGFYFNWLDSDI